MAPRRFIDISVPLQAGIKSDPPGLEPHIDYFGHKDALPEVQAMMGIGPDKLPDGEAWAFERVQMSTHNGTHLDAPWHYHSTMDGGKPSATIDQIPLDWCFRPGVKLDFRDRPDGYVCTAADVETELKRIDYRLQPLDIVVVNTAAGVRYGQEDFVNRGCGMGREATLYLLERGVRVTGIDGWSWDAPFSFTRQRIAETGNYALFWEGHKAGRDIGYCHLEKLHNLESLPTSGFTVCCFPVKVERASAGWTRAVAIIE
jgi:kynurenine formamidase